MEFVDAMARANELSLRALGQTYPNPIVGAVLIDGSGNVIGEGFHQRGPGGSAGAHGEIAAINAAGERARGATLVVTLEPCNHHGKTPPCSEAIISAGIAQVIYSIDDPHQIAQGGAEKLEAAGISVIKGVGAEFVSWGNRAWLHKIKENRPLITAKIATTLDGYISANDGSSKWITSKAAREDVAILRSQCDAIVTGTGTVIADDPLLSARVTGATHQPTRIILGKREIPAESKVLNSDAPTKVIASRKIEDFLGFCSIEGFNHILLEAGPTLTTAFLKAGLIDEVIAYQAPTILGSGRSAISSLGIESLADRIDFSLHEVRAIGHGDEANSRIHLFRGDQRAKEGR